MPQTALRHDRLGLSETTKDDNQFGIGQRFTFWSPDWELLRILVATATHWRRSDIVALDRRGDLTISKCALLQAMLHPVLIDHCVKLFFVINLSLQKLVKTPLANALRVHHPKVSQIHLKTF